MEHDLFRLNIPYLMSRWDNMIPITALILLYFIAFAAVVHILLIKRDPRAALGWIVVCLGFPGVGVLSYLLFGINRIHTRAKDWQGQRKWGIPVGSEKNTKSLDEFGDLKNFDEDVFHELRCVSNAVTRRPLVSGCKITTLHNDTQVYPQMLAAIAAAQKSICLCTYIFENSKVGKTFGKALAAAKARGVDVRIIVDGVGVLYSFPSFYGKLKRMGLNVVKFLPPSLSKRSLHLNLRTHRKILVIDGKLGFTGGMNVTSKECCDLHFRVEGPAVAQLEETFFEDWYFVTGERLASQTKEPISACGMALCRGVTAGPNEDFEKLRWIVNGAFSSAKKHIRIMTPYFIPDAAMTSALTTACLKGVTVEIILPEKNNLPYVGWATEAYLEQFLAYGVKVYYRPKPFAHSKLLMIDDFFSLIGSANLDPRSLRLNFEFNLEVYDKDLASSLTTHFEDVKKTCHGITLEEIRNRPVIVKLRNAAAKLFSPYL